MFYVLTAQYSLQQLNLSTSPQREAAERVDTAESGDMYILEAEKTPILYYPDKLRQKEQAGHKKHTDDNIRQVIMISSGKTTILLVE